MSSTKLFLVLTIAFCSMAQISSQPPLILPCNQSAPCEVPEYVLSAHFATEAEYLSSCKGGKLQCCFKTTESSCTTTDGFDVNGNCACVPLTSTLLDLSTEIETNPGQGCLNGDQCKYVPHICKYGSICDCRIDHNLGYKGRCEHSRVAKCGCQREQYATSG